MRTLVVVEPGTPIPQDAVIGILEAFGHWRDHWRSKMDVFEFFAGRPGGWAVFNTDNDTELSQAMFEFPLTPFSVISVHPTINGDEALGRLTETFKQMVAVMAAAK